MPNRRIVLVSAVFAAIFLAGITGSTAAEPYTFGVVPQFEQRKLHAIWFPVINELRKRTGLEFNLITTLNIGDFEKKFSQGGFDFAYTNPYHVLMESKKQGYIPLVRDKAPLKGILVVRKDSPVMKPEELAGKTVAFPSPNAVGAALLMRADLERLYKAVVNPLYVKTHSSVYLHVVKGLTDAGGGVEKTFQEQDKAIRDELRVIYTTRAMPSHPVSAHPRVHREDREKVRRALLEWAETPEGKEALAKIPIKQITRTSMDDYREMLDWGLEAYWDPFWRDE